MTTVLVTGGAGYIGSHVVLELLAQGYEVVILDNFSRGARIIGRSLEKLGAHLKEGDAGDDFNALPAIFHDYQVDAVVHLAAFAYVGESVQDPVLYYENNIGVTTRLLKCMLKYGVNNFVFSSTCATYGIPPTSEAISEDTPQAPINPYGFTKLAIEHLLRDLNQVRGLNYCVFRYFNAAGADPEGRVGEIHDPEPHIIPNALRAARDRGTFSVLGNDFPTQDGSAVRDYIHVSDIATAHVLGILQVLQDQSGFFNLANGKGYSVLELIRSAERVTGKKIRVEYNDRRPGDPPALIGAATKATQILGWNPKFPDLETILSHAWLWEQKASQLT